MTERFLSAERAGIIAFDVIRNKFYEPLVNGRINHERIEDMLVAGIYSGELEAMTDRDAVFIVEMVEDIVFERI